MTPIIIRKNKFGECQYNGTPCYYVEHIPSGGRTIFDHDRFLLNNLIEIVGTDGGALHWSGGSMKFRDGSPLRGYLLAEYRNVPYAFVKSKYVHLKQSSGENSIENCTSDNLYHSNEAVQTLGNRKIMRVGDCLKIAVKKKGETQWIYDYTEYDPDLFEILARTDIFSPWLLETKSGYRTYTEIRYGHEKRKAALSVLIYVFHRLRPEPDDFAKTMIKCIDLYSDRGIQIDHLNSDIHNQFIWNLSAIPKSQNNAKNRATAKIKSPYFLHTVAMYDGTYRFCFGYSHRTREYGTGRVRYFRCNDIDDLTRFVKEVMALKEPTAFFKKKWVQEHLPIELYKANREARPDSHRIGKACQMATHMLSKDKFEFELWAADSTIETALAD